MLFFDCVVNGEVVTELVAHGEELADRHAGGTFAVCAGGVQVVPCPAEVLMLGSVC